MTPQDQLSAKQRAFLRHLKESEDFDTTEAARKAGYKNPAVQGSKLSQHPTVRHYLRKWQAQRERRTNITADRIVEELANIAFSDPTDLIDENGQLNAENVKQLDGGTRKLIDSFKQKTNIYEKGGKTCRSIDMEISTITSGARMKALELLLKHVGEGEKHTHEHKHTFDWDTYYHKRDREETDHVTAQLRKVEYEDDDTLDAEYSAKELIDGELA